MSLLSLEYKEFINTPREWILEEVQFNTISTLVVGKNSTGKSRLLAVTRSLCGAIGGIIPPMEGDFKVSVHLKSGIFQYLLNVENGKVQSENLRLDERILLDRHINKSALLYFEKEGRAIESEFLDNSLAIATRQDNGQHPWFVEFADWARKARHYSFAVGFHQNLVAQSSQILTASKEISSTAFETGDVISTYIKAFERFKEPFDQAVISDMRMLGFPITDVGLKPLIELIPTAPPIDVLMMYIIEDGVSTPIPQSGMSQGMYRTLALLISLNAQIFANDGKLILIDDIGEGLDYERSTALIKLLLTKNEKNSIQIVMATNDRFVMNHVPLDNWCILQRVDSIVSAFSAKTHKETFEEFEFTGLSNFDFFRSNAFSANEPTE